jgi:hypothetical protein
MKIYEDFAPNFGDKSTGCCIMTTHHLVLPFSPRNMTVITHPLTHLTWPSVTFLFPQLKIKLKGHHFDTTEVIEAESQAVLNSLTELDFQDAFKNGRSPGNCAYAQKVAP